MIESTNWMKAGVNPYVANEIKTTCRQFRTALTDLRAAKIEGIQDLYMSTINIYLAFMKEAIKKFTEHVIPVASSPSPYIPSMAN